jgi:hypothetical protein
MLEASRMMPSMLGMPRMSAGLAGSMPGAPLMGGLHGKVGGKGWEIVGVGRLIRSKIMWIAIPTVGQNLCPHRKTLPKRQLRHANLGKWNWGVSRVKSKFLVSTNRSPIKLALPKDFPWTKHALIFNPDQQFLAIPPHQRVDSVFWLGQRGILNDLQTSVINHRLCHLQVHQGRNSCIQYTFKSHYTKPLERQSTQQSYTQQVLVCSKKNAQALNGPKTQKHWS